MEALVSNILHDGKRTKPQRELGVNDPHTESGLGKCRAHSVSTRFSGKGWVRTGMGWRKEVKYLSDVGGKDKEYASVA